MRKYSKKYYREVYNYLSELIGESVDDFKPQKKQILEHTIAQTFSKYKKYLEKDPKYADKILKLDEETFEKFRKGTSLELDLFRDQFKTNYEILDGIANTNDYLENFDVSDIYIKTSNGVEKFIPKES